MNMWIIGVELIIHKQKYLIFSCYHSPNSSHAEFLTKFEEVMSEWTTKDGIIVFVGDLNINMAQNTYYSTKLDKTIKNLGLKQIIDKFTRVTSVQATIKDLLIRNKSDMKFTVHSTPRITDHLVITINLSQLNG